MGLDSSIDMPTNLQSDLATLPTAQPKPVVPVQPKPTGTGVFAQPVDKQALALARSIALKESGTSAGTPNYEVIGDNGTAAGSGQWSNQNAEGIAQPLSSGQIPNNFKTAASKYGLDPNDFSPQNQDKVLYAEVYLGKQQGLSPAQIAAAHNAGLKKALDGSWEQNVGVTNLNGKQISYNTPAYVQQVKDIYDKQLANLGSLGQGQNQAQTQSQQRQSNSGNPQITSSIGAGGVAGIPTGGKANVMDLKANLSKTPGAVAKAANDVLPILGDIGGDVNGSNSKTALQQGGDAVQSALSAALLIPGAQPEDLAAKAGLTGLTARIGANAATGGLIGASNAVGQGKSGTQVAEQGLLGAGLGGVASGALEGVGALQSKVAGSAAWEKIQNLITPKITSAEGRLAQQEGRIVEGKSSLLGGTKPDTVIPSPKVQENTKTILKNIPGAADMNPSQLADALNEKTTTLAQELKPKLKAIPINKNVTGQAFDAWKALKAEQADTPDFLDNEAGNKKFQQQFENRLNSLQWDIRNPESGLLQKPTPKTADDLWTARKAYDESIPTNVKNATSRSAPQLQTRQKMWLQNRDILNKLLDNVSSGLDSATGGVFKDMSNMYDARQTIVKNTKVNTKGTPGLLKKGAIELAKYAIPSAITGGILGHLLEGNSNQSE